MECATVREQLRDLARGRVDVAVEAELRAHLAGCEACRHEEQAERLLDEALTKRLARVAAPAATRQRVGELLERTRATGDGLAALPRRRASLRLAGAAAAAVAAAVVGFVAGRAVQDRTLAADRLADEVVTDHLRALASTRPPDVESGSSHEVKPWFEGRLDFAPVVPGDRGELRLVGGSLGYVMDRKAAVLSYALRRHRVTLLAFPRSGLAGFERVAPGGAPLRLARSGFAVTLWEAGDLGYALVTDVGTDELGPLAAELAAETRR